MAVATPIRNAMFSSPDANAPPSPRSPSAPFAVSSSASARARFALSDDYGDEAARELAAMLRLLTHAGFAKATATDYSVFDRILGGICWLLQCLVQREDAAHGRVQWPLLFQPHEKMKPRLGLAQDVVARLDWLSLHSRLRLQPHQLLLQDFGDIGAVRRLVQWLVELLQQQQQREAMGHLETIREKKAYLKIVGQVKEEQPPPLKREVVYLQRAYQPRRRYQYATSTTTSDKAESEAESEDALIQKCLLEYGERVAVATVVEREGHDSEAVDAASVDSSDPRKALMAQLAAASVAAVSRRGTPDNSVVTVSAGKGTIYKSMSKDARDFEAQYQRIVQQALVEQSALLEKQRAREAELLRQVVSVPETLVDDAERVSGRSELSAEIQIEQTKVHDHLVRLATLENDKQRLARQRESLEPEQLTMTQAVEALQAEAKQLENEVRANQDTQPLLPTLWNLVTKNEALKKQKSAFKEKCKTELEVLETRVVQLRRQTEHEALQQDEETLRLNEIEQMHVHMAAKHKELRVALARQTRHVQKRMKQIDDVPSRMELLQYEKRFLELYDEVTLTLDETRKYYSVYNTLKTTHEFLEKEIALINSMHDNFDVAMASKSATQVFFSQLDSIIQNVETSVRKQQTVRADHQARVETLDSKYQLLLEKERAYVNAIREFQKECEKNEKLSAKFAQYQHHHHQADGSSEADEIAKTMGGVSSDDGVL